MAIALGVNRGLILLAPFRASSGRDALRRATGNVAYFGPKFYIFVHQNHGTRVDLQWRVAERYFSFSLEDNHETGKLVPVTVAGQCSLLPQRICCSSFACMAPSTNDKS